VWSLRCLKSKYLWLFSARRVSRHVGRDVSAQVNYLKFSIENNFDFVDSIKRKTNKLKIINKNNNKYPFAIRENTIIRKK
jgi:hypothetical protein